MLLFTVDFTVRGFGAYGAGRHGTWLRDPMNWIDFLAIAPFYLGMMFAGFVDLRFLRVTRLVRILKSFPATSEMGGVIHNIISRSIGALFIPLYFMCLCVVTSPSHRYQPRRHWHARHPRNTG